jgi:hypothetical protein
VGGDANRCKALAYGAYKAAPQTEPLPSALIDRIWMNTLRATELAPPSVGAKMYRRAEVLYRLLIDQHGWPRL